MNDVFSLTPIISAGDYLNRRRRKKKALDVSSDMKVEKGEE